MSAAIELQATVHCMVESPPEGAVVEDEIRIEGWCVSAADMPATIRVRAAEEFVEVPADMARSDVATSFPHLATAATSGFAATSPLPSGKYDIAIDARFGDGDWRPLGVRSVVVRATPLRASLDTPPALTAQEGLIRFSGWCVHPKLRVADLRLSVGTTHATCQYGSGRADVAAALPGIPGAELSGFEATIAVKAGTWPVALTAVLENGSEVALEWPAPLHARALPLANRLRRAISQALDLLRYGWRLARTWIRDNRRLPWPHELPAMIRFALERYRQTGLDPAQALPGFVLPAPVDPYEAWQAVNPFTPAARTDLELRLSAATGLPLLSVVMPVRTTRRSIFSPPRSTACAIRSTRTGSCASPTMRARKAGR